jgi:hypothetical protein
MNRREVLQRTVWLVGGAICAPTLLSGCSGKRAASVAVNFDATQSAIIDEVAEIIIPRTATPGARDAGVPKFIESMVKEALASDEQERFVAGLADFTTQAQRKHGAEFLQLAPDDRVAFVYGLHADAIADERARQQKTRDWHAAENKGTLPVARLRALKKQLMGLVTQREPPTVRPRAFILMMKELTLLGFFNSQAGATQVLQYEAVPGRLQSCVPLKVAGNGKTWAVETTFRF